MIGEVILLGICIVSVWGVTMLFTYRYIERKRRMEFNRRHVIRFDEQI